MMDVGAWRKVWVEGGRGPCVVCVGVLNGPHPPGEGLVIAAAD
jgi:hypothetical protein